MGIYGVCAIFIDGISLYIIEGKLPIRNVLHTHRLVNVCRN